MDNIRNVVDNQTKSEEEKCQLISRKKGDDNEKIR